MPKPKYVIRKYDGDDSLSWGVFKAEDVRGLGHQIFYGDAMPIISGLNRTDAREHCQFKNIYAHREVKGPYRNPDTLRRNR